MSQADYIIDNQSGADFRSDLNDTLEAIVTNNSGDDEPDTTYAYMLWADTTEDELKLRDSTNSSWLRFGSLTDALGEVASEDVVPITMGGTGAETASDARTNLGLGTAATLDYGTDDDDVPQMSDLGTGATYDIATEAQAEAGTSNATLMTPLRVAEAVAALATNLGGVAITSFTSTGTWERTTGCAVIIAIVQGAGGGGGGSYYSYNHPGSGGGSGCTSVFIMGTSSISSSATCTVGGGGTGGTNGDGGTGGTSSFSDGSASYYAIGGTGGSVETNTADYVGHVLGGAGGTGNGNLLSISQAGGMGLVLDSDNDNIIGGKGGDSAFGGQGGEATIMDIGDTAGNDATNYGAGGSGAVHGSGGNGSDGYVQIIELVVE